MFISSTGDTVLEGKTLTATEVNLKAFGYNGFMRASFIDTCIGNEP